MITPYKASKLTITTMSNNELLLVDTGTNKLRQILSVPSKYIVMFNSINNNFYVLSFDYQNPNDEFVTYL